MTINQHSCEGKTEAELIRLARGDAEYFVCIMRRFEAPLLRYIHRITSVDDDEAADLLQEIFIKAYKNLNAIDETISVSAWLYRATRNHVISSYRKQLARPQLLQNNDDEFISTIASDVDLSLATDQILLRERLNRALSQLPDKYREVVVLRYFEEKEYKEISDITKKPIGTISTLLSRAKGELKRLLTT